MVVFSQETAVVDPCRSPECQFYNYCALRPIEPAPPGKSGTPMQPAVDPDSHSFAFSTQPGAHGLIGWLHVGGRLNSSIMPALNQLAAALPTLAGLFAYFDCHGGENMAAMRLERALLVAKQSIPVIGFVHRALSGAVLPALACNAVYGSHASVPTLHIIGCEFGCFGTLAGICDGHMPRVLVSRQTPKKYDGWALAPILLVAEAMLLPDVQNFLDQNYEDSLAMAAKYTGRDPDDLRGLFDGRVLERNRST